MRRSRQQITDQSEIERIIKNAATARIGINRDGAPYIVPMNFGYSDGYFFLHSAKEGLKIDLIKADPRICIEIDESSSLIKKDPKKPCSWGVKYRSVIATGTAEILTSFEQKKSGLQVILAQVAGGVVPPMDDKSVEATEVIRVAVENLTAKQSS